ncbi:hypothetical protein FRC12_008649 [Ceratobasidium sp. 428]|nr:hypothetical protein FRC12_008649 [Ceratobasidium sp. 428]
MSTPPTTSLDFDQAADAIASGAPVSIGLLRAVSAAIDIPAKVWIFDNRNLASACIRLLQERSVHCSILDDEFCILCLRIIVACLQATTLIVCGNFLTSIDKAISQPNNPNFTMTKFAIASLSDLMLSSVAGGLNRSLLDPSITAVDTHLEFLTGWSFLLFPAWAHLICGRISAPMTIAPMIGDLACRFSVGKFPYDDEQLVIEFMTEACYTLYQKITRKTDSYYLRQIDEQDSKLVILGTTSRLHSGSLSLKLSYDLFLWAAYCSNTSRPNMMGLLLEASSDRLWRALGPTQDDLPLSHLRLLEVAQFPGELLRCSMSTAPTHLEGRNRLTSITPLSTALDCDIFSLLAQALMFPLPCDYNRLTPVQQKSLNSVFGDQLKEIEKFTNFLSLNIDSLGIKALQESHADWLKAAQHFDEQCRMHNPSRYRTVLCPAHTRGARTRRLWVAHHLLVEAVKKLLIAPAAAKACGYSCSIRRIHDLQFAGLP